MQRIGRVNRIGSTAQAIYNYMFYPSDPGDSIISLKKNSLIKLQSFHSALGEDTKIYSHDEIVKEFRLFNSEVRDETDRNLELLREVRTLHDTNPTLYRRIKHLPPKSRCARASETLRQTIAYLSSETKKAYYLVDEQVRELSFLEAVDIFSAVPSEKAVSFGDSEGRHYEQVQQAMKQYALDQKQETQEEKLKIGSRDNDAKKAAAFLREIRPALMNDQEVLNSLDRLKKLVERGSFNQLADQINRMSRKHKKTPMQLMEIVEQLEALDKRYGENVDNATHKQPKVAAIADIILSETFV